MTTPMTADSPFWMPGLLSAEEAARRMLRALARGRKVYNFPWTTYLMTRIVGLFPDWLNARIMAGYNDEASRAVADFRPN